MSLTDNTHAKLGDNLAPDYAREVIDRLDRDYPTLPRSVEEAVEQLNKLPPVTDEATASLYTEAIRRTRDLKTRIEGIRVAEKEPHLRAEQAVDQWAFGLEERLERRKRTDKLGAIDAAQMRLHAYNEARLAEERRKREEAARIAREAEEKARAEREAAQRAQREAEEKAARARKQANIEAAEKAAAEAQARAGEARKLEEAERARRQEAEAAAAAKSADLVRERHDSGAVNTMKREGYAEIINRDNLDFEVLKPFFKEDHVLQALRLWARTTQFRRQMNGANIGMRDVTVVR